MRVDREQLADLTANVETLTGAVAQLQAQPASWIESVLRKRLIVHTLKGDLTIDGSLTAVMADGIVLRVARIINDGAPPTSLAGEVFLPKENVNFVQLDE